MKQIIKPPFFEIGVKNYVHGDAVLNMAIAADAAAMRHDVDVIFIAPYCEIRRVAENTSRLVVFAPYMDTLRPGRGMADVLPEAIRDAGARGVVINHSERPVSMPAVLQTIKRADEMELLSFVCANTIEETETIARLHPDIINPEPTNLIGSGETSDMNYVAQSIHAAKSIYPTVLVEQAAGITSGQQVYNMIIAGADGTGAASGVFLAANPIKTMEDMVLYTKKAREDMRTKGCFG